MATVNVIAFESRQRLLAKARNYMTDIEGLLDEEDKAIGVLLKALRFAQGSLMHEILLVLGTFAKQRAAEPFYRLLRDPQVSETLRQATAIQLGVMMPAIKHPQTMIDRLMADLESPDAELRSHAALALGWEGNGQAAIALIDLLFDPDADVQQAAVTALTNLRDDRIFNLMLERLDHGPLEQKRVILFNLWRFDTKRRQAIRIYRHYLNDPAADMRLDALVLLTTVAASSDYLQSLTGCLEDGEARIRKLALEQFMAMDAGSLKAMRSPIARLTADPDPEIRHEALGLIHRIDAAGGVHPLG